MSVKSLANKSKGKWSVVEDDDSDFAPPTKKSDRHPVKKKVKFNVAENILLPGVKKGENQADESLTFLINIGWNALHKVPHLVIQSSSPHGNTYLGP
ncbi:hypothetical protein CsatB_004198 [Cannabis sativa]